MGAVAAAETLAQGTLRTEQVDEDHGQARGDERWLGGEGLARPRSSMRRTLAALVLCPIWR
jgi:hypothetical protein